MGLSLALGPTGPALGAEAALPPVVATVPRLDVDPDDYPAAVSVVGREAYASGRRLSLDQGLDRVPGVHTQNRYNAAQDLRLSVRGFGARSPFGVRGIRALVDDVPYTVADGQSQLDALDPAFVEQLEVIRGPASALYGNAAGGVFRFTTLEPPESGEFLGGEVLFGSHGERAQRVWGGRAEEAWRTAVTASNQEMDGYRDHSGAAQRRLNIKLDRDLAGGERLRFIANLLDAPEAQDPGGLSREQVRDDRRQATDNAVDRDAGEEVEQQTGAVILTAEPSATEFWEGRAFLQRRDFYRRNPFPGGNGDPGGIVTFERYYGGVGGRHVRRTEAAGRPVQVSVGTDAEWQYDDRQRYVNNNGREGERTNDQRERAQVVAGYLQADWEVAPRWRLVGGGRLDWTRLSIDDREAGLDTDSQTYTEPSYLAGVRYAVAEDHSLYAKASSAFETPTLWELWDRDAGGIDDTIEPQQARSVEVGVKGRALDRRLRYELTLFQVRTEDELVPQEDADGPTRYANAGETRRRGVELGVEAFPTERLEVTAALAYGQFTFRDFETSELEGVSGAEDPDQVRGNRIPGVPRAHGYLETAWQAPSGWRWAADVRASEGIWADDRNTQRSSGYTEVGLHASRTFVTDAYEAEPFFGVNNLFDATYDANVRINAANESDNSLEDGGYFEPAPERTIYAGIRFATY
ncbi:TonB-dependent receptor family protein [Halorhodospira halophila]|uniref:TonB-dependent receptor, plug n=1 Tax=Halorhodospira halophila (strain DSM 244 / SL1) TaxID=349124 RepID=A1WVX5_HALHL|nr:TonB-dependent receptor [Halorhodospira halophila]ABM61837.1 TonB-dependent receptor, plug [Halorhodospira halophila SL1]